MSQQKKRRAVYTALAKHFEGNDLLEAMLLWQTTFARTPDSSLAGVVKTINDTFGKKESYQAIFQDFKECLSLPEYLLQPDPLNTLKSYAANRSGIEDAPARAFGVLVLQIGRSLDLIEQPDLPIKIYKSLRNNGAEGKAAKVIEKMIREDKARRIPEEALGSYPQAINAIYVALCEALGPVASDEILSKAVRTVDQSRFGKAYSAQNFL